MTSRRGDGVSKLDYSESEAAETHTLIGFSVSCGFTKVDEGRNLFREYDEIASMLFVMAAKPQKSVSGPK